MEVFIPEPDATNETNNASSQLECMNRDSHCIPIVTQSTSTSNVSVSSTRPAVVNTTNNSRKRCFSVLISPGNVDSSNACSNVNIQQQQLTQQNQQQQQIIVHPKHLPQQQRTAEQDNQAVFHHTAVILSTPRQKIPRPPNAFMLFANEWRKKLAVQFPRESNKDISVRLGAMWKTMQKEEKEKYFVLAREVDAEHKRKYPDYVYNPKEARMRKALREQSRETRNQMTRCHTAAAILPGSSSRQHQQWASKAHHQTFPPGIAGRQTHGRQGLVSPRMLAEQQRSLEETKKAIREQVEQGMLQGYTETYLDIEAIPYHQLTNHMSLPGSGDYAVIAEIDGQQWLPYMQAPQPGATYMMRANEDAKLQQGGPWTQYTTDARTQQVPPYPLRQQMINRSYGSCIPTQPIAETSASNQQATIVGQMANHSNRSGGSNDGSTSNSIQQQQYVYQQQQAASNSVLTQNMVSREAVNREERMQMLELIPTSSANNEAAIPMTTSTTTTNQKSGTPSTTYNASNSQQQTTVTSQNKSSKNLTTTNTKPEISSTLSGSSNIPNGTENTNGPLPAFEQAFGSTEIGRYSHEGFFNTTQQTENQQSTNNQNPEQKSNPAETVPNSRETPSVPEEYPPPGTPLVFSPTDKVHGGEALLSPGWPSLYFYSPGGTSINTKLPGASENGHRQNISMSSNTYACYGSPQFPPQSYAAYFDYALLSGAEFIPGNADPETVLVGVPSGPGFGDGNELQVALDGGGSTVLASGNTFRDTEAGLDYVTLHIPANSISSDPLDITNETRESIMLANESEESRDETTSEIIYEEVGSLSSGKLTKMESYEQNISIINSNSTQMGNNTLTTDEIIKKEDFGMVQGKRVPENKNLKDDLERQDLIITGVAMREPIVISQTERICVLMDTPNPVSDGKEFTSL